MNVGDYVRTKSYGIKKINGFSSTLEEDFVDCDYDKYQKVLINKKEVVKSSPNIIDLISIGDYVNGEKVEWVGKFEEDDTQNICHIETGFVFNNSVKSIVTKEQFSSMQYEVN